MKTLFENHIIKIDTNRLIKDIFINATISALIFSLFISILTWTKPNINKVLIFILVFVIIRLLKSLKHNYRNHLERISLDNENGKIIINHIKPSIKQTETIMSFKEIRVSKIKHMPFSWFSLENYFWISDNYSKIKISTCGHENREININEIHSELNNIQQNV
ncbi:hypothetical protein [Tenacibaculum jejuense]|uniref:Uncharacterized protein n=1 Tax=Tenacibaculum jejuense TaxID=584609 RepID=A0A238U6E5_9FLAO|nr:hypothetical protein [Tenacibaculum jejuense]SNR14727.1 protein of unknown function [Tenacibaculum jejuense]